MPGSIPSRGTSILTGSLALSLAFTLSCASSTPGARPDVGEQAATTESAKASPAPQSIDPAKRIPTGPSAEFSIDGLVRVPTPESRGRFFVKPPRPHLNRYEKMILVPTLISYKEGVRGWTERDEELLQASFREELLRTLEPNNFWSLTNQVDGKTLIIRASVVELEIDAIGDDDGTASSTTYRAPNGGAVIGFEIFEPRAGKPLMRYVERFQLPGGLFAGIEVDQQRVKLLFYEFASHLGTILQQQYDVIQELERRERAESDPVEES